MNVRIAIELRSGGRAEDRASHFSAHGRHIFVLADGAGGTGSGAVAAEHVVKQAQALLNDSHISLNAALENADIELSRLGGTSTGVIVEALNGFLSGSSCGDSVAWLISTNGVSVLTQRQRRKPLVGDGVQPVSFGPTPFHGRLLLASDGLTNYASTSAIITAALGASLQSSAHALAELPKLAGGSFPDDVAVMLVEADV